MDDITNKPRPKITDAEKERRRNIGRRADAEGRLEGQFRSSETDHIFEAFVEGEIEVTDIVPRLKAHYGLT